MSIEKVRNHLKQYGLDSRIMEFDTSSATVELAAQAVGCEPARIGKTMSFKAEDKPILILTAGDAKIDNVKYKNQFHVKAKMLAAQEVEPLIGHGIGGVCPFGINEGVDVYLDCLLYTSFPIREYDLQLLGIFQSTLGGGPACISINR